MTESDLLRAVESLCDELGLAYWHDRDSRRNAPGLPDLLIAGKRIIFAELKSKTGTLKPAQRRWRNIIRDAGGEWYLWYPGDLRDGTIRAVLESIV